MSRAFVNEDSEALVNREAIEQEKKLRDWLRIQEKKLKYLETDPEAEKIDQELREKWIRETREDIERARRQLDGNP
ncbi:MAG TPA: hypothetical protein P5541_06335 [Thermovirgaceae bacterium]|jgi:hypothetical protein|nr:hypothetical protein [Thermovirgaceae bacterium]